MRTTLVLLLCTLCTLLLPGCDRLGDDDGKSNPGIYDSQRPGNQRELEAPSDQPPPAPPINESFEDKPQLTLFPRVGDYQPEPNDERHPFWRTFIDHLVKVSGLLQDKNSGNKVWGFRGINSIDSVAFFSPLAVEPSTTYRISYRVKAELPEGVRTGIGILEFDQFLWVGEQYTEQLTNKHLRGSRVGVELTGNIDWDKQEFTFATGPETRMIHLVFYLEGETSRMPVLIDDIEIVKKENKRP